MKIALNADAVAGAGDIFRPRTVFGGETKGRVILIVRSTGTSACATGKAHNVKWCNLREEIP